MFRIDIDYIEKSDASILQESLRQSILVRALLMESKKTINLYYFYDEHKWKMEWLS